MINNLLLKATHFAAEKHKNQKRKGEDASPYINHPLFVALLLSENAGVNDQEILAAALLHDTVEDTNTTPEEIENSFGKRIRDLVAEVTDDKSLPKAERKLRQIEHAKELSVGAALIKIADKISNVLDVTNNPPNNWDLERRREYLNWAEKVVANMSKVNEELENEFRRALREGRTKLVE
jgi:(p)ppGpp synthase/HD superfamily hydrolase